MSSPLSLRGIFLSAPVILFCILLPCSAGCEEKIPTAADQILEQLVKKFASLQTLSYTVKRVTPGKGKEAEEKWFFRYRKPDRIRIDYLVPIERLIILDNASMFEYVPSKKYASRIHLSRLPTEEADQVIARVLLPFAVPGLTIENAPLLKNQTAHLSQVMLSGKNAVKIEFQSPRYVLYIDPDRLALLRTELYDETGSLVLRTVGNRFTDANKTFVIPQEIRVTYGSPDGFVNSTIFLSDIAVDTALVDTLFAEPALPDSIQVKELN